MKAFLLGIVFIIVGTAAIWAGQLIGFWWITLLVGLILGFTIKRTQSALLISLLCGGLGWALPLLYRYFVMHLAIGKVAAVVAGIVGIGSGNGWLVLVITGVAGIVLCLSATWVGVALRQVVGYRPARPIHFT